MKIFKVVGQGDRYFYRDKAGERTQSCLLVVHVVDIRLGKIIAVGSGSLCRVKFSNGDGNALR